MTLPIATLALLAACGGGGGSDSSSETESSVVETTEAVAKETETTDVPVVTDAPVVTEPAASGSDFDIVTAREDQLWSEVVDGTYADFDTMSGPDALNEAWSRLFAWPFEVPMPDDARMSYAVVDVYRADPEWTERFDLYVITDLSVDDARALVADYENDLFSSGVLVESQLTDGNFFRYNFEVTESGEAEGWYSFSIGVGPDTNVDGPTGLTELNFSLERYVPTVADLEVPSFLRSWVAEAPLDADLEFSEIYANWSRLYEGGPNAIDIEMKFEADQSRWAELLNFYGGQDWVQDGLVMENSYLPSDPTVADYVPVASFATLGVHDFDLILERDPADPAAPMKVRYGVSVGNGM